MRWLSTAVLVACLLVCARCTRAPPRPVEVPATSTGAPAPESTPDRCANGADCAWDDPCMPSRCVAKRQGRPAVGCDEAIPPPGRCECVAGRCTLRSAGE